MVEGAKGILLSSYISKTQRKYFEAQEAVGGGFIKSVANLVKRKDVAKSLNLLKNSAFPRFGKEVGAFEAMTAFQDYYNGTIDWASQKELMENGGIFVFWA